MCGIYSVWEILQSLVSISSSWLADSTGTSYARSLLRVGLLAAVVNLAVMTLESNGATDCFPDNSHARCFSMEIEIY